MTNEFIQQFCHIQLRQIMKENVSFIQLQNLKLKLTPTQHKERLQDAVPTSGVSVFGRHILFDNVFDFYILQSKANAYCTYLQLEFNILDHIKQIFNLNWNPQHVTYSTLNKQSAFLEIPLMAIIHPVLLLNFSNGAL